MPRIRRVKGYRLSDEFNRRNACIYWCDSVEEIVAIKPARDGQRSCPLCWADLDFEAEGHDFIVNIRKAA